jgi:hypothetical protein
MTAGRCPNQSIRRPVIFDQSADAVAAFTVAYVTGDPERDQVAEDDRAIT